MFLSTPFKTLKSIYLLNITFVSSLALAQENFGESTFVTFNLTSSNGKDAICENLFDVSYSIKNGDVTAVNPMTESIAINESKLQAMKKANEYGIDAIKNDHFKKQLSYLINKYEIDYLDVLSVIGRLDQKDNLGWPNQNSKSAEYNLRLEKFKNEYNQRDLSLKKFRDDKYNQLIDEYIVDDEKVYNTLKDNKYTSEIKNKNNLFLTQNDAFAIDKNYVQQKTPNTCYAASLANIWNYFGWQYQKNDFLEKRVPNCNLPKDSTAGFVEIIQTAFFVRVGEKRSFINYKKFSHSDVSLRKESFTSRLAYGSFSVTSWSSLSVPTLEKAKKNLVNYFGNGQNATIPTLNERIKANDLYVGYDWWYTNNKDKVGKIRPVRDVGDIIYGLLKGHAILVGLKSSDIGHTLLVTGAEYHPDFHQNDANAIIFTPASKITKIRLLDPANPNQREKWYSGKELDNFFKEFRFGILFSEPSQV